MSDITHFQTDEEIIKAINLGEEHPYLDFKQKIVFDGEKKEKAEITKDIIAMANSGGGLIIGGVKQTNGIFVKCGMTQEELKGFDSTKINQFVNNHCDPPINSTTRVVNDGTYSYGVIIVPEFSDQPHIVNRNSSEVLYEGDLLVRTSNNESRRAGPHELRELLDRGLSRRQGVFSKMLQKIIPETVPQIIEPSPMDDLKIPFDVKEGLKRYKGFRIIKITPIGDTAKIKLVSIGKNVTKSVIREKRTGGESFPPLIPDLSNETRIPIGLLLQREYNHIRSQDVSYFGTNGLIYCASSLWEDEGLTNHPENSLGLMYCIRMVFESLLFLDQYYRNVNWKGYVMFEFSVESSTPRQLIMDSTKHWPIYRNYQNSMSIPVSIKTMVSSNLNLESIEELTSDLLVEFFWYFNWDVQREQILELLNYLKTEYTLLPESFSAEDKT